MHQCYSPELSVVADLNPLLLQIASEVISGETVPLYEFPIAPLDEGSFAVSRNCRSPIGSEPISEDEFLFVLADAMNPPFGGSWPLTI